jgi:hypothetical protein
MTLPTTATEPTQPVAPALPSATVTAPSPAPAPARPPTEQLASPDGVEGLKRTIGQFKAEWLPRLQAARDEWEETLPPEAVISWTRGAAYIRESCIGSLAGEAPDVQLRQVLSLLARKKVYVAPDSVFFDVHSGADVAKRAAFQRMYEDATKGGIKAIGVFLIERMFRNVEQAIQVKRDLRLKGIELHHLGQFEGDQRNPGAWQLQMIQDFSAEMHARNVGFYVGTHFEQITRAGRPVGLVPEVYVAGPREKGIMGHRGKVSGWTVREPLASVMQEGCRRFLAGATLADLGAWAATTELEGLTPNGRVMDKHWWHQTLRNPRFAGYQVPTTYTGYRPGVESEKPPRKTADSELVPCLLPALWSLENYREIHRVLRARYRAPKRRKSYRQYLLSGVAYDATCGHSIGVTQSGNKSGHFWMGCIRRDAGGTRHAVHMRGDVAERELDELLAGLSFEDADLLRQIEEELRELARIQESERQRFRPNPEIGALRQALAALSASNADEIKAGLEERIASLEALDQARQDALVQPLVNFRRALEKLGDWQAVWQDADKAAKNQLLRDAGLKVTLGRLAPEKREPARILEISADNPAFELALAAALSKRVSTEVGQRSIRSTDLEIVLRLRDEFALLAKRVLAPGSEGRPVLLTRPSLEGVLRPAGGLWLDMHEAAERSGLAIWTIKRLIRDGSLEARSVGTASNAAKYVRADQLPVRDRASVQPIAA